MPPKLQDLQVHQKQCIKRVNNYQPPSGDLPQIQRVLNTEPLWQRKRSKNSQNLSHYSPSRKPKNGQWNKREDPFSFFRFRNYDTIQHPQLTLIKPHISQEGLRRARAESQSLLVLGHKERRWPRDSHPSQQQKKAILPGWKSKHTLKKQETKRQEDNEYNYSTSNPLVIDFRITLLFLWLKYIELNPLDKDNVDNMVQKYSNVIKTISS